MDWKGKIELDCYYFIREDGVLSHAWLPVAAGMQFKNVETKMIDSVGYFTKHLDFYIPI